MMNANIQATTTVTSASFDFGGEKAEATTLVNCDSHNDNKTPKNDHDDKDDDELEDDDEEEDTMSILLGISPDGMCMRHPQIRILMPEEPENDDDEYSAKKNSLQAASGAVLWHTCPICKSENRARHMHPRAKSYANVIQQVKQLQATPEFQAFIENWGTIPNQFENDNDDDNAEEQGQGDAFRIQGEFQQQHDVADKRKDRQPQHQQQYVDDDFDDGMELPPPPPPMDSDDIYGDNSDEKKQFHDAAADSTLPPPPPSLPPPPPPLQEEHVLQPSSAQQQHQQQTTKQELRPLPRVLNRLSAKDQVAGSMKSITTNSTRSLRLLEDSNVIWVDRTHLQSLLERMDQVHDWVLRQRDDELEKLKRDNQTYRELLMEREEEIRQMKDVISKQEKTIRNELKEIKRVAIMRQQQSAAAAAAAAASVAGNGGGDGGGGDSGRNNNRSGIVINHMKVEVNQGGVSSDGMHMSRDFSQEELEHILHTTAHATMAALGGSGNIMSPITSPNPIMTSPKPTTTPRTTHTTPASAKKAKSLSPARNSHKASSTKPTQYRAPATMTEAAMSFFSPQVTNRSSIAASYTSSKSPGIGSAGHASFPSLAPPSLADFDCYPRPASQMPSINSMMSSFSHNGAADPKRRSINTKAGPAAASAEDLWAEAEQKRRANSSKEVFWDGAGNTKKVKDVEKQQKDRKRSMSLSPRLAQSRSGYVSRTNLDRFNLSGEVVFIPTEQEVKDTQKPLQASVGEDWLRTDLSKHGSNAVATPVPSSKPKEERATEGIGNVTSAKVHRSMVKPTPGASPMPPTRKAPPLPQPQQHLQQQPQQSQQQQQPRPIYPRPPSRPRLPQITESPSLSSYDVTEVEEEKKEHGALLQDEDEESITMGSNSETPPPKKTVTVDRKLQAKLSGLTLTTLEFHETMEASHGRIISKARRELPMEQELDFDGSEPSQTGGSRKPSITSVDDENSFQSRPLQASNIAVARRPSKEVDDEEQSISVNSENDALHYRAKDAPHIDEDEDEGSRFSASETSRRNQSGHAAVDGFIYQVAEEAIRDPYGDEGTYWGFMSAATGFPHGQGTMSYQNGRRYEGEWKHGRWHGRGRLVNPNGDTYEGEFDCDARHGYGCYKWANGNMYEGDFFEDKRHGKGTFTFSKGNVYKGDFIDGMFEGNGRYEFEDGFYEGEWKKGRYEGQGLLQYLDGSRHQGQFVGGIAHGAGETVNSQGAVLRGVWENGKPL